jgi:hypothetical protein
MNLGSKTLCIAATLVLTASALDAHAQSASPEAGPLAPAEPPAATPPPSRDIGLLVRMGVGFGGKELAHVQWSDGEESKLKAGQLLSFAVGGLFHPAAPWAVEGTVGYKFDQVNGSNGSIKFTRIPVDVVGSYVFRNHRLGAGVTAHLAPKFACDAAGICSDSVSYSTALGAIAQYAYGFRVGQNGGIDLGARYTRVKYSGSGLETIDGSGFGFFFGGWL